MDRCCARHATLWDDGCARAVPKGTELAGRGCSARTAFARACRSYRVAWVEMSSLKECIWSSVSWPSLRRTFCGVRRGGLDDVDSQEVVAEMRKPLGEQIAQYNVKLQAANRSPRYVRETIATLTRTSSSRAITTAAEISSRKLAEEAAYLFGEGRGSRTVQSMLSTWKSFTSWLVTERKLNIDSLKSVEMPSAESKRKYRRRMLLPDEWQVLHTITSRQPLRFGMSGPERALLYRVAIQTGYRAKELASLSPSNVVIGDRSSFIHLRGAYTKNGKPAKQYIDSNLASDLQAHIAVGKKKSLFALPHCSNLARMIRQDLEAARAAWIKAADGDSDETERRHDSTFLCVKNEDDEVFDFHALRHTCGAWLASTGTDAKIVQSVMRHSTITLTFDLYGHLFPGAESDAAGKLGAMIDRAVWESPTPTVVVDDEIAQRQVQHAECESLQSDASACEVAPVHMLTEEAPKSRQIADLSDVLQATATACESAPSWTRTMNLLIKRQ